MAQKINKSLAAKRIGTLSLCIILFVAIINGCSDNSSDENISAVHDQTTIETTAITTTVTTEPPYPNGYCLVNFNTSQIYEGDLILVNNNYEFRANVSTSMLPLINAKTDNYYVKDNSVQLNDVVIEPLNCLLDDFYANTYSKTVMVISGYRSVEYQQQLYDNSVQTEGEYYTSKYVALAGHSEHHTGYALDLSLFVNGASADYDGTGIYSWINENAYKYGFIVRYPDEKSEITGIFYEPWHYRYVGFPHSYIIEEKGICYEEYIDYLRGFDVKNPLEYVCNGVTYRIYFTAGTDVPVPESHEYSVSGNNVDGFIVTEILP